MLSEELKVLTSAESTPDEKIEVISNITTKRLLFLLKTDDIPEELEYIIIEVTLKRYNRLGNEGIKTYTQEGLTETFSDNDFDEFKHEIDDWLKENDKTPSKGVWRFL